MTVNQTILHIAVPKPIPITLEYLPNDDGDGTQLKPGIRIKIPFRNSEIIGVLVRTSHHAVTPHQKLKKIIEIIDREPILPADILKLLLWAADYYHYPLGDVFSNAVPKLLRLGKTAEIKQKKRKERENVADNKTNFHLNEAQLAAVNQVINHLDHFQTYLLEGVTGSGKTEVYLRIIEEIIQQGKQALVLVPEIGLTPQTLSRFQQRFSNTIAIIHSHLTDRERLNSWLQAQTHLVKIVIGTRSAIFTPLPKLGIIIIDEEHDTSFKQQDGFKYSARDVAIMRARQNNIPVILGSATPSLESIYNVQRQRYFLLNLPKRAGIASLPRIQLLDIRNTYLEHGLSPLLIKAIDKHLQNDGQILLFLNRRGFATSLICHTCGWSASCSRCDAHLTLHYSSSRLICHHCGAEQLIIKNCPSCQNTKLQPLGMGTERIELALQNHFKHIGIARIDRDTTRKKGSLQIFLDDIHSGKNQILVGTQMLAKGHHFPNVTLAAILDADGGFLSGDLRASEHMGQLITQVSGRSGRGEKSGEVIIQTRHPENTLLLTLINIGYNAFAKKLLKEREHAKMPPFAYLAMLRAEAFDSATTFAFLNNIKDLMHPCDPSLQLMGPIPAPMQKKAGKFRGQLLFHSLNRIVLHQCLINLYNKIYNLKISSKVKWSIDVDPMDLY